MSGTRTVGGSWLSVHAPTSPRAALLWLLDRGFRGVVAGPGPRAVDWRAVARAREQLPMSFAAVAVSSPQTPLVVRPEAGMASANEGERQTAFAAIHAAVELATDLGVREVILSPGLVRVPGEDGVADLAEPRAKWTREQANAWFLRRNAVLDRALDTVCRFLHHLCKAFPDIHFCLVGSSDLRAVGEPAALAQIFADLRGFRLGYWHDAAVAARRGQLLATAQGEWLHAFAARLAGVSIADTCDGSLYTLPGSGAVDYPLIASYLPRRARDFPVVLDLDPAVEPAELPGAHAFLDKFGL